MRVKPLFPQSAWERRGRIVWYDVHTFQKHNGEQSLYIPVTMSSLYRLRPLNPFFLSVASQIPVFQRGGSVICRKDRVRRSSSCMENDPYALYVALNSQGSAEGELYIDDFHTFSFEKAKQFVHRHLSFAANTLSSSSVCALFFYTAVKNVGCRAVSQLLVSRLSSLVRNLAPDSQFSTASWIEKIVIIRGSQPSSATLKNADGTESAVEFEFDSTLSVLTLRKPRVNTAADWTTILR
ncbi:hypothetical protein cypCar_00020175 [Cyprinus carpio]|nr:hypothetical protein cypCar_00020175 [Cyprinus carpio]